MIAWLYLILAGFLEIGWAIALKAANGFSRPVPTMLGIAMAAASLFLLSLSLRSMPASVAYPVWVGIGMAGVTAYGAVALGEPQSLLKTVSVLLICVGVAGLANSET